MGCGKIQLGFPGLIGRPLASNENLKRLRFDLIYKF
jgi:hypothetical protein